MFRKTLLMFLAVLVSCTSTHKSNSASTQEKQELSPDVEKYKTLAIEKYKDHIDYAFNESKTHVLCQSISKSSTLKPENSVRFFVYDIKNDAVVIEETYASGSVRWINDRAIEVTYHLGVSSNDPLVPHSGKYIFDIITKLRSTDKSETK